jgi:hypothetical protein
MQRVALRQHWLWFAAGLTCVGTPASAQWNLTGTLGYSRSQSGLGGGLASAIGVARTGPGVDVGFELATYDLGSESKEFRREGLFPSDPPGIHLSTSSQHGWRLTASLDLLGVGRFTWIGGAGYYRFTGEYSSETLDTTRQQVLRPRVEYGGSSNGAGLMTGIRFDMIRFSPTVGLSLEATVHGVGIRSSGEDAGYGFFNFFALGGRLRLRI